MINGHAKPAGAHGARVSGLEIFALLHARPSGAQGYQGKQRQRADIALQRIVRGTGRPQVRAGVAGGEGEFDIAGGAERISQPGIGAEVTQVVVEGNRVEGHPILQREVVGDARVVVEIGRNAAQHGNPALRAENGEPHAVGQEQFPHGDRHLRTGGTHGPAVGGAESGRRNTGLRAGANIAGKLKLVAAQQRGGQGERRAHIRAAAETRHRGPIASRKH